MISFILKVQNRQIHRDKVGGYPETGGDWGGGEEVGGGGAGGREWE